MSFFWIHAEPETATDNSRSGKEDQASRERILAIQKRAKAKRRHGVRLSALERHISRSSANPFAHFFGPSCVSALISALSALLRPVPILAVLALIAAAEASSSAWFAPDSEELAFEQNSQADDDLLGDAPAPLQNTETGDSAATASSNLLQSPPLPEPAPIVPTALAVPSPTETGPQGLVQFISGVIAVYYPAAGDAGSIARHIVQISQQLEMDPLYVASIIAVESRFKSHVRSRIGATGLMQLRPSTAVGVVEKLLGRKTSPKLTDPQINIFLGIKYLKELENRYHGNRFLALAAYNWGPDNVSRVRHNRYRMPGAVQRYATTILELSLQWQNHFKKAAESAEALAMAVQEIPQKDS